MNYYHQFLYILNNLTDDGSIYDLKTHSDFFLNIWIIINNLRNEYYKNFIKTSLKTTLTLH